ncbi:hypothetical protein [Falsiphaeobacter marinintestinus]|uniref:hypothetical protein n=1 Tax=Falsiphaeobacter marinintestinus TaxID=1492905 RepID=UPI0011B5C654|nr:hypothetical protein [Phaeobacter marinintestinus]
MARISNPKTRPTGSNVRHNALGDLLRQWIDWVDQREPPKWITLYLDSSVSLIHEAQDDAA